MKKATFDDLAYVTGLYRRCAVQPNSCWGEEYPNEEIAREDIENGWLYLWGEKGAATLLEWDDLEDMNLGFRHTIRPCVLCRLCLAPEHQGRGEGKKLLGAAEQQAKQLGYQCMHLLVDAENPAANRLYQGAGYAYVATVELYGCTFHAMEKRL